MTTPSPVVSVPREPTEAMLDAARAEAEGVACLRQMLADGLIRVVSYSPALTSKKAREALEKALPPHEEGAVAWYRRDPRTGQINHLGLNNPTGDYKPLYAHPAQQSSDVSSLVEEIYRAGWRAAAFEAGAEDCCGGGLSIDESWNRDREKVLAQAKQVQGRATWAAIVENGLAEVRVNGKRITSMPSYAGAEEVAGRINAALRSNPESPA